MKFIKKLFSLTMTVAMMVMMLATFGTPIKADDVTSDGKITIENAKAGTTYEIYRIFDYSVEGDYTVNETWQSFTDKSTNTGALEYVEIGSDGKVTWKVDEDDSTKVNGFAELAKQWAESNSISNNGVKTSENGESVVFDKLPLGYYMVVSSDRSLLALVTTKKQVTIVKKNELPNIDKEVEENGEFGDSNTAGIGDTVNFKATITAEKGATNYVFHDKMSEGLSYNKDSVAVWLVKKGNENNPIPVEHQTDYTFTNRNNIKDGCAFEIVFTLEFLSDLEDYDKIEITYSATINEKAVIKDDGNLNTAGLSYGEHGWVEDDTITKVYGLDIFKYTNEEGSEKPLSGAEFVLYRDVTTEDEETGRQYLVVEQNDEGIYKVTGWTDVFNENEDGSFDFPEPSSTNKTSYLVSGEDGYIHVEGLDAGEYYLLETEAPKGYNPINDAITITIDKDGNVTGADENNVLKVLNNTGTELPSTGGIGTTIFYVVGGLLMVGAVVLLVTKKKMSVNDDK